MKTSARIILVLALLIMPVLAQAQTGGYAGAPTRIGYGPRAMAMSNAFTAATSEGIYPYYNPALAAEKLDHIQLDMTASSLKFDRVFQTLGAKFQLPPTAGLYIGVMRTGVKDIDERTLSGYPLGSFDASEYQILSSFGLRVSEKMNAGINFKINFANYHPDLPGAIAVGVDVGLLYKPTSSLNIGLTIQDMFANYRWDSKDLYGLDQSRNVINNFPIRYKLGVAYQKPKFTISTEFEVQSQISETRTRELFIDGSGPPTIIEGFDEIQTSTGIFRIGGSWNAHERFTLRGGYRITDTSRNGSGSLSTGFSVHLPFDALAPSIDYAFIIEPYNVASMHVLALRLHL